MRLAAKNVSFQYDNGNKKILNNVSMGLEQDERVGITTPSGFGKTTFCKILVGHEDPDHRRVLLDGKPLSGYRPYCPAQIVWRHPEMSMNPRLRMAEVIEEGDGVEERILNGPGIEPDWISRLPGELFGGELQRFCIAKALGKRTRFLLADEISIVLDLITQNQIWNFLLEGVGRRGIGLVAMSHSGELLERMCTRVVDSKEEIWRWT